MLGLVAGCGRDCSRRRSSYEHGAVDKKERRLFCANAKKSLHNLNFSDFADKLCHKRYAGFTRQLLIVDTCANLYSDIQQTSSLPNHVFSGDKEESATKQLVMFAAAHGEFARQKGASRTGAFFEALYDELQAADTGVWPDFFALFERVGVLLRGDPELPRALLIDEIDKADIDLPNDLLNIFEEGQFEIQELSRLNEEEVAVRCYGSSAKVSLTRGRVRCHEFPFVVMTSNGERDFPAPFLRRCLRLDMPVPWIEPGRLEAIVYAHFEREQTFDKAQKAKAVALINGFLERAKGGTELLATDQLLNAIYLVTHAPALEGDEKIGWLPSSLRPLNAERL